MISKGGKYPTAQADRVQAERRLRPGAVVKHGNDDAQLFENFEQLEASDAHFNGFPSSLIQGSYDLEGTRCTAGTGSSSPPARRPPTSDTWSS